MMAVAFRGKPIPVEFRPFLSALRGQLVTEENRGTAVHAASFLRERRILLDRKLLRNARECDRILAHEIFHFVWWKAGSAARSQYEALLRDELACYVPGEMGWSAEWRKEALHACDWTTRTRRWRDYLCESFCDSAAAQLIGLTHHPEITLPATARKRRARWIGKWMEERSAQGGLTI